MGQLNYVSKLCAKVRGSTSTLQLVQGQLRNTSSPDTHIRGSLQTISLVLSPPAEKEHEPKWWENHPAG